MSTNYPVSTGTEGPASEPSRSWNPHAPFDTVTPNPVRCVPDAPEPLSIPSVGMAPTQAAFHRVGEDLWVQFAACDCPCNRY